MIIVFSRSTSFGRSVASSLTISSRTREGRAESMTSVVPMAAASSMECVTNTIVRPVSRQIRRTSPCMIRRFCASSAPNGSSISRSSGSMASARAIAARCRIPPLTRPG
jgi:hypothetical protein